MIIDKPHRNIFCINSTKMGIVEDYILITGDAQQEYGNNTVLLMQVGSFFEIYGLRDAEGNVTGIIARVGQRFIESTGKKIMDQGMENFKQKIASKA